MQVVLLFVLLFALDVTAQPLQDFQLKPPNLSPPSRGSVIGHLANADFGPADVSRGTFTLKAPFVAPDEHGAIGVDIFPTYSPDSGLSEWGYGWKSALSLERYRSVGDLDYANDDLRSPWGVLRRGTDGYFYPLGLQASVRVALEGSSAVAFLPDGTRLFFGGVQTARITTASGVYAWYVTSVVSQTGRLTSLSYVTNWSGRPYLSEVTYGGTDFKYPLNRLTIQYEQVPAVRDYRSGELRFHDKKVSQVVVSVRQPNGSWVERSQFGLNYRIATRGIGFYLTEINQKFASQTTRTLARYKYTLAEEHLARVQQRRVAKTDTLFNRYGPLIVQSEKSSVVDFDEDGLIDLEVPFDERSFRQTLTTFELQEPLEPPIPGQSEPRCRPGPGIYASPRMLVKMLPGATELQVVIFSQNIPAATTEITVCTREGNLVSSLMLSGYWAPSPYVVLADIDRDELPDIVRAENGRIRVLHNISTATTLRYEVGPITNRDPIVEPHEAWVLDVNGDGRADVVTRYDSVFRVHHGLGRQRFDGNGQYFQLVNKDGFGISDFDTTRLTFFDANKDGLVDLLRRTQISTALYINDGRSFFWETGAPAVTSIGGWGDQYVVPLDLDGTGNFEIFYNKNNLGHGVALEQPDTGLLNEADDARGTSLRFTYGRAAPFPGVRRREVVLNSVTRISSGNDAVETRYSYGRPVFHPTGRFLLGYETVKSEEPAASEEVHFLHDQNQAGLLLTSTTTDLQTPGVIRYEERTYDSLEFQGLSWKRPKLNRRGWASGVTSLEESEEYLSYQADLCPALTIQRSARGTLTIQRRRAEIPNLDRHLHCLEDQQVFVGSHSDASLDFRYEAKLTRNQFGLMTRLESVGPAATVRLQDITYSPDFTLAQIDVPGRGMTRFEYEPRDLLLKKVIVPDGSELEVVERDPVTSSVLTLTSRNGSPTYSEFFRYDDEERLSKRWNSLGKSSEANPSTAFSYEFATALEPAAVHINTLVNTLKVPAVRAQVEWFTAAGESLANAEKIPEGWAFSSLTQYRKSLLETRRYTRATEPETLALETMTHEKLNADSAFIGSIRETGFGHQVESVAKFHADVERKVSTAMSVTPSGLEMLSVENGTHATVRRLDASQHLLVFEDEAATRFSYVYDALGRMRSVQLPDGTTHRVNFDDHGRTLRVQREGIATIEYEYSAATGLLQKQLYLSPAGVSQRSEEFAYDLIGRKMSALHTDLLTGETQDYRWYYDGATPEAPLLRTHLGVLSGIEGKGYGKRFEYRADGKLIRRTLRFDGWRTVEVSLAYSEAGEVQDKTVAILDTEGRLLSSSTTKKQWDQYGRLSELELNGSLFAVLVHDSNGLLSTAVFSTAEWMTFGFDALTRANTSVNQAANMAAGAWRSTTAIRFNERGLLEHEDLTLNDTPLRRSYEYSPQQFLMKSTDARQVSVYDFDGFGLPTAIEEQGIRRDFVKNGQTLVVGNVSYTFDALGRTVSKDNLEFVYGPNGSVARAQRGSQEWYFLYDEAGQRILKRSASGQSAAYLEDGNYLDDSALSEPVHIGSQLAGIITAGNFRMLGADARGTVTVGTYGEPRLATPFGHRTDFSIVSAIVDYVGKGFDADLGLIRMGVRDYDPTLNRFLTPDPLFLEKPDLCMTRPGECNLYSYSRSNPVNNTDPSGMYVETAWDAFNVGLGIKSIANWDSQTTFAEKAQDSVGLTLDVVSMALPLIPGGFSAALKAARAADRAIDGLKSADKAVDAAKALDNASNAAKAIDKSADIAKAGPKTLSPGPHAGDSIPSRGPARDFTRSERDAVNKIGGETGCHTCGIKQPGTKSGDFVPDHQPPSQLAPGASQRLYPHCKDCSRLQGGEVNGALRRGGGG